MSVMAKYVRIFWPDPKDEDVARRNKAIVTIQSWMSGLEDPWSAIKLASALTAAVGDGVAREEFVPHVERAIVDAGSDAFVRDGHDLEMNVVTLVAALDLIRRPNGDEGGWTAPDALAAGLWSAMSFQQPVSEEAVEMLRQEVIVAARERTMRIAEQSRMRAVVPEVGLLSIPESQPTGTRAKTAYRKATEPLVKALRENAELDREELEFLWWSIEDWSDCLNGRLSDAAPVVRAVVAGIDGAAKLRRLPASGHRNVVLRGVPAGELANLDSALTALGDFREKICVSIDKTRVAEAAPVFPLLSAITDGVVEKRDAAVERDARDWGARALLERGIIQVASLRRS
ncbi:GTPase-associated system all-helical protein GASH [Tsuneonella suprasediminis]|uniref:GTPase-associated system all-helical protein GASH n=1 Tax=Tsuneonella suprasediminis TaxID=2306996 RepID=UPI002F939179